MSQRLSDEELFVERFKFKQVTPLNWLKIDHHTIFDVPEASTELGEAVSVKYWFDWIATPNLHNQVPDEVMSIYECARGMLHYGVLFYPLFTIGHQHALRAAEAAAFYKCEKLGLRMYKGNGPYLRSFSQNLEHLKELNLITDESDWNLWLSIRDLRNSASHPKWHSHATPEMVLPVFEKEAELINKLFP